MPHVFLLITVIFGIIYGVFKFFVMLFDTFSLLDERFVSNVKETNNTLLNFFITNEEDETQDKDTRRKMKIINRSLRFDIILSTLLGLVWFIYPFMLIQLTPDQIEKIS